MSSKTKNIMFACDYIFQASNLLKDVYPDVADTLDTLSITLYKEIPLEERIKIENAERNIERKRDEIYGGR